MTRFSGTCYDELQRNRTRPTEQQLESLYRFALEQLQKGDRASSIGELVDLWELQNPPAERISENVAAIQASLSDMLAGAIDRDAAEVLQQLKDATEQ